MLRMLCKYNSELLGFFNVKVESYDRTFDKTFLHKTMRAPRSMYRSKSSAFGKFHNIQVIQVSWPTDSTLAMSRPPIKRAPMLISSRLKTPPTPCYLPIGPSHGFV